MESRSKTPKYDMKKSKLHPIHFSFDFIMEMRRQEWKFKTIP